MLPGSKSHAGPWVQCSGASPQTSHFSNAAFRASSSPELWSSSRWWMCLELWWVCTQLAALPSASMPLASAGTLPPPRSPVTRPPRSPLSSPHCLSPTQRNASLKCLGGCQLRSFRFRQRQSYLWRFSHSPAGIQFSSWCPYRWLLGPSLR